MRTNSQVSTVARFVGGYALVAGFVCFLGWALDVPRLTDWHNSGLSIQPNSAIAAIAAGAALLALEFSYRRIAVVLGFVVALIGATALFENLTGVSLEIDTLFLFDRSWGQLGRVAPGRMGLPGSICWTILGTAFLLVPGKSSARQVASGLGVVAVGIAMTAMIGFLYGANLLHSPTTLAMPTATMILAIGIGVVISLPDQQPMRSLMADFAGRTLAWRVLPFVFLLLIGVGALRIRSENAGLLDLPMRTAILVVALIACCSAVLWSIAAVSARERALAASELRLAERAHLLDLTHDAIFVRDPTRRIVYWNRGAEELYGWTKGEALGQVTDKLLRTVFPYPAEEIMEHVSHFGSWSGELVDTTKDGRKLHVSSRWALGPQQGTAQLILQTSNDITHRKRSEEALRSSEQRLAAELAAANHLQGVSTQLMQAGDITLLYDRILDAAAAIMHSDFATIQKLYPERGEGELRLLGFRGFPPEVAKQWEWVDRTQRTTCAQVLRTGKRAIVPDIETCDFIAGTDDVPKLREAKIAAMQSTPLVSRSGTILGMISTHWSKPYTPSDRELGLLDVLARQAADLIERTQADQTIRESEERYRTLVSVITDVPWTTDSMGAFVVPQPEWAAYTGQSWEEYRGFGWADALHPDDREEDWRIWKEASESRSLFASRGRVWHAASEQYRYFEARAMPLLNADGSVREWVGTCTDVHEQKQAEQALRDADKRKDEFLATLAHELRNPLAPVRNSLELMKRAGGSTGLFEQARFTMERQIGHMVRLIDDLLDLSRITRNVLELRKQRVPLGDVIERAVEASLPHAQGTGQQLVVSLPSEPIHLDADPVRLAQALSNLLNNACKFTERDGRVAICAERQGSDVVIRVQDNGIGIPPDKLTQIFDMFVQVDQSLSRTRGGLGIGLTLVKRLVELHDGTVTAHSSGPGTGSEFVMRLPLLADRLNVSEPATKPPRRKDRESGRRILVVDDNQDAARTSAMLLKTAGHETVTAFDGVAAVEAAERYKPEVVLLDIGLPKLSGYEVARKIREQFWGRDMVLVAITGWAMDQDRVRTKEAGFDAHMVKPVEPEALFELISDLRHYPA